PIDNTIWLAFEYYNQVYIIDTAGQVLDSVAIKTADFRLPQPPVSRLKSNAVFQDWLSKCTPVRSFNYVAPNRFVLQYETGLEKSGLGSRQFYATVLWTADRNEVVLDVDETWRLVGVHPDGRVVFVQDRLEENKPRTAVIYIARIEP
ncbi:MAG: hypothetical protein AB1744_10755, partial [Candidatus Zixiibacteriota bacterium]